MFGAAAALDAGEGLQGIEPGDVFAGIQTEIFIAREWRNMAEAFAFE